jgi:hypothetical protein
MFCPAIMELDATAEKFPQGKKKHSHTGQTSHNAKKKKQPHRICDKLNNWPPGAKIRSK